MKSLAKAAVLTAVLSASSAGLMGVSTASADTNGCASGDACIYAGADWGTPTNTYYTYGSHNLSNQVGTHRVFNNQTDGATLQLCTGYNGSGCGTAHAPGWSGDVNLTPINSIVLSPAGSGGGGGSSVGGRITTSQILARMKNWYDRKPAYSQTTYIWDLGNTRKYRTDCSGFADMALHLSSDPNTSAIASSSAFTKRYAVSSISRSKLNSSTVQAGDVFDDTTDGHAFVFASWNSNGTFNYYNFGGGSTGTAPPEYHTNAKVTDSSWGYEKASHYVVYRYTKAVKG